MILETPDSGTVKFVQFLMPNGRRSEQFIELPKEVADKAQQIWDAGLELQMEMLPDFCTCSFTVTHPEDGDLAGTLCPNGPQVISAITTLIMDYKLS